MTDISNNQIPTPWELHPDERGYLNIHHPSEDGRTGDLVATVYQDEAHANLIKNAPRLLTAIKALIPFVLAEIEQRQTGGNDEDWCALDHAYVLAANAVHDAERSA